MKKSPKVRFSFTSRIATSVFAALLTLQIAQVSPVSVL